MSSLAFDKQGKPFAWHKRTAKLRARLFRNPSARGTCCQVLDDAGAPLFIDADVDYTEFRRAVSGVPGLYRLDQCDEDGVEIDGAPPAYVSIEQLRNAGGVSTEGAQAPEVSPLLIIERLVALQSDVMKTMAVQHAAILASSAEIMRAPYRPVPLLPAAELRNAGDENNEGDDDDDDEIDEANAFAPMLNMLEPHLPRLGAFLYTKFVEFFRQVPTAPGTTSPAVPSTSMPETPVTASTSPRIVREPVDVAVGVEPAGVAVETEIFEAVLDETPTPRVVTHASQAPTPATTPTPEQLSHLLSVREQLAPAEQALVEHVIKRMPPELLAQYLGTLSTMSIDEATTFIRTLIAQARPDNAR